MISVFPRVLRRICNTHMSHTRTQARRHPPIHPPTFGNRTCHGIAVPQYVQLSTINNGQSVHSSEAVGGGGFDGREFGIEGPPLHRVQLSAVDVEGRRRPHTHALWSLTLTLTRRVREPSAFSIVLAILNSILRAVRMGGDPYRGSPECPL